MDSSPRSTASSDLYSPLESTQPEAAPITNGIKHDVLQKRKREEDPICDNAVQNSTKNPVLDTVTDGHASGEPDPSLPQGETFMEKPAKRPRANGYMVGTKTDPACTSSTLPAALWQHVLSYVPPVSLGRMLSVNRAFNTLLTSGKSEGDPPPLPNSTVQPLNPEAVWAISRRRFCPGIRRLRPIHGLKELDMWKLLKGRNCQICKKVRMDLSIANPQDPWESGPGDTGVRVVWPFGLRCCGACLQENTQKVAPN